MPIFQFFSPAKVWSHGEFHQPWAHGSSIFEFLSDDPDGGSERSLPDEEKLFEPIKSALRPGRLTTCWAVLLRMA